MKRFILAFCFLSSVYPLLSQYSSTGIAIIPEPVSLVPKTGIFNLSARTSVVILSEEAEVKKIASLFSNKISAVTGYPVTIKKMAGITPGNIQLIVKKEEGEKLGSEGYMLNVTSSGVTIVAAQPAGLFYALQTMVQLLPPEIESNKLVKRKSWPVPAVEIIDYPRFNWRGLMLDVVRHFFDKEQVKQFIDQMVKYKFNLLHLHLTDDQGWRLEIKGYPRLTEVGAWREERTGYFGLMEPPPPGQPKTYGGYFTQEDIKELVQYAKERYVNILPEIDVPGHSLAALAAYPHLASVKDSFSVASGQRVLQWTGGGKFHGLVDNSLCPGKEAVYTFLDSVFTQLAQLFPFNYIHIGGDETAKNFWDKSDDVKELMKRENLKDFHDVHDYFVERVERIVNKKGKNIIGWDEIMSANLGKEAIVMAYINAAAGAKAAMTGKNVVMSPEPYYYLDYMQGDVAIETYVYDKNYLKSCYEFEPIPEGVDPSRIKGGQGNLWTELVYNMRQVQYMLWPRAFAVSEGVWSPKDKKRWSDFEKKVEKHFDRYEIAEIKYAPSMYDPVFYPKIDTNGDLLIDMLTDATGLDIHYSFDHSFPDKFYPKYIGTVKAPKDASVLRVITYRDGKPKGRMITVLIADLRKRIER